MLGGMWSIIEAWVHGADHALGRLGFPSEEMVFFHFTASMFSLMSSSCHMDFLSACSKVGLFGSMSRWIYGDVRATQEEHSYGRLS